MEKINCIETDNTDMSPKIDLKTQHNLKYLSIDVGIKNLSYCLFVGPAIEKWDVININTDVDAEIIENNILICTECNKKGIQCSKKAIFEKNDKAYCNSHSKKCDFIIPIEEFKPSKINKMNVAKLDEVIVKYKIPYNTLISHTKQNKIKFILDYFKDKGLDRIIKKKCIKFDMVSYCRNITKHFNELFNTNNIKYVFIENQMTSQMRILSFVMCEYFLSKNIGIIVEMISPCYKLKELEKEKTDYDTRKKNSIKHCLNFLENDELNNKWIIFFNKHSKKDDLSDAFLQGLYMWNVKQKQN